MRVSILSLLAVLVFLPFGSITCHGGLIPAFETVWDDGSEAASPTEGAGMAYRDPTTGIEFVKVLGGCFEMGDTIGDGNEDEKPPHKVCLDSYYLGKYEVTQGQWQRVMEKNPSKFHNGMFSSRCDNCPVERVSWRDVQEFITRLNGRSGKKYRLPTEAEWEYAARSGGKQEWFSGGDDIETVGWRKGNAKGETHPVGQKQGNGLGIHDMSGNVWEWVRDWHKSDYYQNSPGKNPQGPPAGSNRVVRGGSFDSDAEDARSARRFQQDPAFRERDLGFRLAWQ